ncbi:MAG: formate dehydrogenase accessory sulfurtransferase FdhD [Syntrophomonadaceae bacterium]|jgi:FdhD protein|nr:formate dehydrogenase accessory sulfurtransferase FdhD [Syntrophomonadaceae bacterium]
MSIQELTDTREVTAYDSGQVTLSLEPLVTERYLKVKLNGEEVVRLASSPHAGRELAVGYLISEGILDPDGSLLSIDEPESDVVEIVMEAPPRGYTQSVRTINTCIGRGYGAVKPLQQQPPGKGLFTPEQLLAIISELDEKSYTFKKTGGVHSAGLGGPDGLIQRFEDIGRHNAVDKVFGYAFLNRIPLHDKCLVLSGRVAFEILQKAAHNRIPFILSRSAPTLLTVDRARELGITVVGFARGQRFNVYSHPERVCFNRTEG